MNKTVRAFLILSVLRIAEPFPVVHSQTSARPEHAPLLASSDDPIDEDSTSNIDSEPAVGNSAVGSEDTKALSGLLGEMFEAKLETSRINTELESLSSQNTDMPILGNDGVYRIISQIQLENFKAAHPDELLFLKFSSPICAACRMLKHKFQALHRSEKFAGAPVIYADIVISNNKKVPDPFRDYVTSQLQVQRVPCIHFYAGGNDSNANHIYCDEDEGACSWPKIQQQMLEFVGRYYTVPTKTALEESSSQAALAVARTLKSPTTTISITATPETTNKISKRQRIRRFLSLPWLRKRISFT
mmetsp:Transcript_165/g.414  ORF Transcript_165/g.414 Transcript_165/m.414 type:complete len:302 (-) Transcript_165:267-1172(-)